MKLSTLIKYIPLLIVFSILFPNNAFGGGKQTVVPTTPSPPGAGTTGGPFMPGSSPLPGATPSTSTPSSSGSLSKQKLEEDKTKQDQAATSTNKADEEMIQSLFDEQANYESFGSSQNNDEVVKVVEEQYLEP